MTTIINASSVNGITISSDTSGQIALQSNGTTVATVSSTGMNVTNLTFTSAATAAPAFSANLVSQSLSSSTVTKITFTNKSYDTNNNFASSRFTPTVAGYYLFVTTLSFSYSATSEALIYFYKNGSYFQTGQDLGGSGAYYSLNGSAIAYMNGSTDYMEIYGYTGNSGALSTNTIFSGCLLRSA